MAVQSKSPSPSKGSVVAHCHLARKVPKPRKTGNDLVDSEAEKQRQDFMEIITTLTRHPKLVSGTHGHMRKLLLALKQQEGSPKFLVDCAKAIPPEWWAAWVVSVSDFTKEDLVSIRHADNEGPLQLGLFATQLSIGLKLDENSRNKDCFWRVCVRLHEQNGLRLPGLKALMDFDIRTGQLDWGRGSYQLVFNEARMSQVTHRATAAVATIPAHVVVSSAFGLKFGWSDYDAQVVCPPLPPFKLHTLFADESGKPKGPHTTQKFVGTSRAFNSFVEQIFFQWKSEQDATNASSSSVARQCAEEFKAADQEKRRGRMSAARAAAAKALAHKESKRLVRLS